MAAQMAQARISSAIVPSGGNCLAGTVVQIFAHGLDVQPESGHLFYVGSFDKPLSCIGLQLPGVQLEQLLDAARIGDVLFVDAQGLFLTCAGRTVLHLVWEESERVLLSFAQTLSPDQMSLRSFR